MKHKILKIIFAVILISFSFVYVYAGSTTCSPTSTYTITEQLQIQDNYVKSLATEIGKLGQEVKATELKISKLKDSTKKAKTEEELRKAKGDLAVAEDQLKIQREDQTRAEERLKQQQLKAEGLKTEALRQRLSTAAGSLGVYRETYDKLSWTNYYIDKWGWMGEWKSIVDKTFAASFLGIEPITSHLCDLWTVGTDSTSNIAFGEDGAASAHVEGVVVETAEDNPVSGGAPIGVLQHRVTFFVSSSILLSPSSAATVQVNLYSGNIKAKELGSYKLGEDVSQIGAQGENTLIASGGVYDLVCLRFLEMWRYKGDFRTFLDKCPDKSGDCLCNRFGASGNALPGGSWAVPGK